MAKGPPIPQLVALGIAVVSLSGLIGWLAFDINNSATDRNLSVLNHTTAVNFLCVDGWDERIHRNGSDLPALDLALRDPSEATVDAALREMGGLRGDGPGAWMTLVAVDPGLSKRFFRAVGLPVLTPIYEANSEEWDSGDFSFIAESNANKEWTIRFGHLERQLVSEDPHVYHGDNDFPFQQGSLTMTNASWEDQNGTAAADLADGILALLERQYPISHDLWPLGMAPGSVIVEPTYAPDARTLDAFGGSAFPTLGWPVLLEVHLIFGKVGFTVVRGRDGSVLFWAARNGTTGLSTDLTEDESRFLEREVRITLRGSEQGANVIFHSERLAQALALPVIRADWLAFGATSSGQTGPQIHQLHYFWDSEARSVNPGVGPKIGDEMAKDLMDGFKVRHEVLHNNLTSHGGAYGIDWKTGLSAVGCHQQLDKENEMSYCGCPLQQPACANAASASRGQRKNHGVAEL